MTTPGTPAPTCPLCGELLAADSHTCPIDAERALRQAAAYNARVDAVLNAHPGEVERAGAPRVCPTCDSVGADVVDGQPRYCQVCYAANLIDPRTAAEVEAAGLDVAITAREAIAAADYLGQEATDAVLGTSLSNASAQRLLDLIEEASYNALCEADEATGPELRAIVDATFPGILPAREAGEA